MMLRADRRNFVASVELASAAPALNWSYARLPLRLAAWSLAALLAASLGWTAETRGSTAAAAKTPGIFSPDHRSAEAAHESRELQPFAAGRWVFTGYGSAAVGKTSHQVYAGH